jgi:hypothetical protein
MSVRHPTSLTWALRLLAGLVALGALATLLIVVLQDQLIRSWAQGRPDTRKVLRTDGLEAVKSGGVRVPEFTPVALTLFVVLALLIWVLAAFLRGGYGWARISLTLALFFLAVGTIAGLRTGIPATFTVLSIVSFPVEAAAAYFLWHKNTTAFLRGTWAAPAPQDLPAGG